MYEMMWRGQFQVVNWTPEKDSHAWLDFWSLLIQSGFYFRTDEFQQLESWRKRMCKKGYTSLCLSINNPSEDHYSLAVLCGNTSFARAYEALRARKPFLGQGLNYHDQNRRFGVRGGTTEKTQGRLILGASFDWMGEKVTVTSFHDDKQTLIACSYHPTESEYSQNGKIKKRYRITHEEWQVNRKIK